MKCKNCGKNRENFIAPECKSCSKKSKECKHCGCELIEPSFGDVCMPCDIDRGAAKCN